VLFKEILLFSGFVEKRLRELLETYNKPDPKRIPDVFETAGKPEDEYRVKWISVDQFEFKCFKFFESKNNRGFKLVDHVNVRLAGQRDHPVLKVQLQKKWISILKLTVSLIGGIALSSLMYYLKLWFQGNTERFYLTTMIVGSFMMIVYLLVTIKILTADDPCVTRLRHLLPRDDWDPGSVKLR
jgi:hypothetical protein